MPEGPFDRMRPATNSTLLMVIREIPVPTEDDDGVLPKLFLRTTANEKNIKFDIADRIGIEINDLNVDEFNKFKRGFGQTTEWKIRWDVSGIDPEVVNRSVDTLVEEGYKFELVEFE